MIRRALIDVRPLRQDADFRRLWAGSSISVLGSQLTVFAVLLQVWQLTHSPVWTGAVGLAHAVPQIALAPLGGSIADHGDRRRVVMVTTGGQLVMAAALAVQAGVGARSPVLVLALVAAQAGLASLGSPARRTFVARLLPPELVSSGLALTRIGFQAGVLLGPAAGGLLVATWGLVACFAVDALSFLAAMYGVGRLPSTRLARETPPAARSWRSLADGLELVVRTPRLRGAFVTDLCQTVLAMPVSLFPLVNAERFGGSPRTLGLFMSSVAVGGVAASLGSGLWSRARRPGPYVLAAAATWGAALTVFGLVQGLAATLVTLAVAGAADTVSVVSRGTLTQLATPDHLRGRVAALEGVVGANGPDLGNARAGLVAGWTTPEVALVGGGLSCVAGVALVALRNRDLRRFEVPERPGELPQEASASVG